jgi:hypothetical protein
VSRPGKIKTPSASNCRTRWICCCIQQRHQRIDIGARWSAVQLLSDVGMDGIPAGHVSPFLFEVQIPGGDTRLCRERKRQAGPQRRGGEFTRHDPELGMASDHQYPWPMRIPVTMSHNRFRSEGAAWSAECPPIAHWNRALGGASVLEGRESARGVSPEDPLAVVRVSDEGQPFASSTEDEELLAKDLCIPDITPHP